MKIISAIVLCFIIGFVGSIAQVNTLKMKTSLNVPVWQPHDFNFKTAHKIDNPFLIKFSAKVISPNGKSFLLPGFYHGNETWIIRVSPIVEGEWKIETKSELPELNGKSTTFKSIKNSNPKVHGFLRVDINHSHHFIYDDSTHFFMQAYEYDWLWALDMDKTNIPTIDKTLNLISRYGFNYVIINSYAYDTKWREGKTGSDDYGPPLMRPWEGSNAHPDYNNMNLAYWKHYDKVINALYKRGMEAHIFIKVYNKGVHWFLHNSPEEKLFFTWLIARYSAYPNIIWDFSKEAQREIDTAYKLSCLKFIRTTDPYHHLITVHDDSKTYESGAYNSLTDFRSAQQHSDYHGTILRERAKRDWPVANVESDYECGPGGVKDKTYNLAQTTDTTIQTLWEIAMAGGYTAYYYTYTAWDVIRPLDVPPGYGDMKHFGDFWRSTKYWLLQPSDSLVSEGYCLANTGREYVVYLNYAKPFTLNICHSAGKLVAEWFNPFTGKTKDAGSYGNGFVNINPPKDWGSTPVILHLKEN
jgi:hypothetical protein